MPIKGWWGDRKRGNRWLRKLPYSRSCVIETRDVNIKSEIYQEVAAIVENDARIAIENLIG